MVRFDFIGTGMGFFGAVGFIAGVVCSDGVGMATFSRRVFVDVVSGTDESMGSVSGAISIFLES